MFAAALQLVWLVARISPENSRVCPNNVNHNFFGLGALLSRESAAAWLAVLPGGLGGDTADGGSREHKGSVRRVKHREILFVGSPSAQRKCFAVFTQDWLFDLIEQRRVPSGQFEEEQNDRPLYQGRADHHCRLPHCDSDPELTDLVSSPRSNRTHTSMGHRLVVTFAAARANTIGGLLSASIAAPIAASI